MDGAMTHPREAPARATPSLISRHLAPLLSEALLDTPAVLINAPNLHTGSLAGSSYMAAYADDIDIYSMPNTEGFRPNVLIMLDNTANWSSSIPTPPCSDTRMTLALSAPAACRSAAT